MDSLQLAKTAKRQHDNVLRDIRRLEKRLKGNFLKTEVKSGGRGRPTKLYHLKQTQAFALLCYYSMTLAHKVVSRWLELEKMVQEPALVLHSVQQPVTQQFALPFA